jgi:hypothetical protein
MRLLALLVELEAPRVCVVDFECHALLGVRVVAVVEQLRLFRGSDRAVFQLERVVVEEMALGAVCRLLLLGSGHSCCRRVQVAVLNAGRCDGHKILGSRGQDFSGPRTLAPIGDDAQTPQPSVFATWVAEAQEQDTPLLTGAVNMLYIVHT